MPRARQYIPKISYFCHFTAKRTVPHEIRPERITRKRIFFPKYTIFSDNHPRYYLILFHYHILHSERLLFIHTIWSDSNTFRAAEPHLSRRWEGHKPRQTISPSRIRFDLHPVLIPFHRHNPFPYRTPSRQTQQPIISPKRGIICFCHLPRRYLHPAPHDPTPQPSTTLRCDPHQKKQRATEQDSVTRHPCEYPIRRPINPAPRVHARYGAQTRPVRSPRQSRTCWLRCLSLPRPAATYSSLCPSAAPRPRSRHEPWPPMPER